MSVEGAMRQVLHLDAYRLADADMRGKALWHGDHQPHRVIFGDREEGLRPRARGGTYQAADVHVARGDDAGEWRDDAAEALQRRQSFDVRPRCLRVRFGGVERRLLFVEFLLGRGVLLHQLLPAPERRTRQLERGLNLTEVRLRLSELLVELGGLDLGQQLPRLHATTHVYQPPFDIAARARVQRGLVQALDRRGDREIGGGWPIVRGGHADHGYRVRRRGQLGPKLALSRQPRQRA